MQQWGMSEKTKALLTIAGALLFIFVLLTFVLGIALNAVSGEPQLLAATLLAAIGTAAAYGVMRSRA